MSPEEAKLREHLRAHRDGFTAGALGVSGSARLKFWPAGRARSSDAIRALYRPTSCLHSAQRIASANGGCGIVIGYALRRGPSDYLKDGEIKPLTFGWAVKNGFVLDGGDLFYGRAAGFLGRLLSPAELKAMLAKEDMRSGLAAIAASGEFPAIGTPA